MSKSITTFIFSLIFVMIGALISQHNYINYIFKYNDYNLIHILNSLSSSKYVFGKYIFENSNKWNSSVPFNYFLFKDKESQFYEFFINDFYYQDGYVYFTYIKGIWPEPNCFFKRNNDYLQFSRISLLDNSIESNLDVQKYKKIYHSISDINNNDKVWLENKNNECKINY